MALALYRRHRRDCKAGHPEELRSSEYDERKKGWKRCACPIFVSGTLQGCFRRHNSGQWEWESAKGIAGQFELAGSWSGSNQSSAPPVPLVEPSNDSTPPRIAIGDAIQIFLMHKQGAKIAAATLRKYRTFTKQLADFAQARGYVMLDQFDTADIDVFYGKWKLGARAKGKALSTLRTFFRFCAKRKWVPVDATDPKCVGPVASDLKPPIGANRVANKAPFTDEELERIIGACDRLGTIKWSNGLEKEQSYSGEDLKDFIWLMTYTGLRISDAGLFNMNRMKGNEVFLAPRRMAARSSPSFLTGCATGSTNARNASVSARLSSENQTVWKP